MVDPQWNILYWGSRWIFNTVCWGALVVSGGQPLFTLGPTFALSQWYFLSLPLARSINIDFYPRPVLAYGYCPCLCLSVRPSVSSCVRHQVCPHDNSSPVQARTTKFGPEVQNTLVEIPIVLGVDWAWPVKFNLFSKSCWFASLLQLWNICETCKNGWKRSLSHIANGCSHIC